MCPWSSRPAIRQACCVLLFGCFLAARPAAAAPEPDLYLEVTVNGVGRGVIAAFTQRPDGALAIAPTELAAAGIPRNGARAAADGLIDLRDMPGVRYRYDEIAQRIAFTATVERPLPHDIDAAKPQAAPAPAVSDRGAVVNYTLYGGIDPAWQTVAGGTFDARLFSESGLLTQSGLVSTAAGFTRLDTTFSHSDLVRTVTWQAGDFISGGLAWTRPMRMAGFRIARNFSLRPDLVTMPLPAFSGTAAVPSTVDVYSEGAKIFSGTVAAGPFSIANLPVVSGAGTARVVTTDALGRTTTSDLPFFADADMLRRGLVDFSLEAGFPRRSYGLESYDYAGPALSGSVRYGISDKLTTEGHFEVGGGVWNVGGGFIAPAGRIGVASGGISGSVGSRAGVSVNGGLDVALGKLGIRARTTRTFGDYADVASATAIGGHGRPPFAIDQASIYGPLLGGSAAASLSRIVSDDTSTVTALSYTRSVAGGTFYVSAFQALDGTHNAGVFAGFSRPLPDGISVSSEVTRNDGSMRFTAQASRAEEAKDGAGGWSVLASSDGAGVDPELSARAGYRTAAAHFSAETAATRAGLRINGEISGALVIAGGEVFAANRIEDAFAVVDTGIPDITVYANNLQAGRTNTRGKLLVTGLHSYAPNSIAIENDDLPPDAEAGANRQVIVPAARSGATVTFAVRSLDAAAIVVLRDPSGAYIPAGASGRLAGGGNFIVGYDGQAYLTGLQAANVVTVDIGAGRTCSARFAFTPASIQPTIDGVICA